jgi:hypothetical protein
MSGPFDRCAWVLCLTTMCFSAWHAYAAEGQLRLHVMRLDRSPVSRVVLSTVGGGEACRPTDDTGFTVAHFTYEQQVPYKVSLIVKEPSDLHFVSPIDGEVPVPHCTGTECFEFVVLAKRGERLDAAALRSLTSLIIQASGSRLLDRDRQDLRHPELDEIAQALGMKEDVLDLELRDWALSHSDAPEDRLIANSYLRDWKKLQGELRPDTLSLEHKSDANDYAVLADLLFKLGEYSDSAEAARRAVALKPSSGENLNRWGLAMAYSFKTPYAELAFRTSKTDAGTYNLAVLQAANSNTIQAKLTLENLLDSGLVSPQVAESAKERLRLLGPGEAPNYWFLSRRRAFLAVVILLAVAFLAFTLFRVLRFVKPLSLEDVSPDEASALQSLEAWFDTQLPEMHKSDRRKMMWRIIRQLDAPALQQGAWSTVLRSFRRLWPKVEISRPLEESIPEVASLLRSVKRADDTSRAFSFRLAIGSATLAVAILVGGYGIWHRMPTKTTSLPRFYLYSGVVRDAKGNPIPGAEVSVVGSDQKFECGPAGEFRVRYTNSEAILWADREGYQPSVTPSRASSNDLQIILPKQN